MEASRISHNRFYWPLIVLGIAATYFLLAKLSLLLSFESSNATPVWPPSGFAFAMVLVFGYRVTPAILLGAFAVNLVVFEANHTAGLPAAALTSLIIGVGNTTEALVGYYLVRKLITPGGDNNYFNTVTNVFRFFFSTLIMCLTSSFVGTSTTLVSKIITTDQYATVWLTWWLGDVAGILLITPFILIWKNYFTIPAGKSFTVRRSKITVVEDLLLFVLVILVSGVIFDNWFFTPLIFRWAFWIIPVVVWAAIRFRQHESVTAILLCSAIAVWGTLNRHGPFSSSLVNESLLIVQSFISITVVTALTLHASILERNHTEEALRLAGVQLDARVKERTEELQVRNEFIETLFDSVEDLMAVFDTKGYYLSVNKKIELALKVKREDVIGRHVLDVFPEVKNSGFYDSLMRAINGEAVHTLSYRSVVSKRYFENFYIPLKDHNHEVYGVLVIGHDNTPVMEASEKIEDINKKLNEAQRLANIGSWQWDVTANNITWSDELYRIYRVDPDGFETTYESYLQFAHPDDRDFVNQTVQEAFATQQPFDFYHRIIRPDGDERIIHGRGEVITNDKKEVIAMAGTAQDVTEVKQKEEEIRQMAKALMHYNKELEQINKELESFTFVASHDLQEPLRKIRTFLSLIVENEFPKLSDVSKDYFNRTIRSAEQMQQLIIDLLSYSRTTGSEEHFKKTDLNNLFDQVKNELKERIEEKKASIETDKLPTLNVIPFQFQQLFTNLLSNSLKFSRADVPPHIKIKHDIVDGTFLDNSNGNSGKKFHSFTFSDNGIGFDSKYNEKVFGLFQRLNSRNVYSGTGIGLSICKKIIENHGGIITARGEKDRGATIQFYLPQ